MTIEVWHNILWARYKGQIFAALHERATRSGVAVRFVHMAETARARMALGPVDRTAHAYPYELLYRGAIEDVARWRSVPRFFWRGLSSRADLVVIAGYAAPQDWAQLLGLMLSRTRRGVFCDSTLAEARRGWWRDAAKRFFFGRVDLVLCYGARSAAMARYFGARRTVEGCQAAALPDNHDAAAIAALRRAARSSTLRLLYVGRLAPEKNLHRLLAAFAQARQARPDAKLRVAGEGPLRQELGAAAEALGVSDAVTWLGSVDAAALAQEYLAATALVLPSLREPWGLVVNEALAQGCPVLVSERCGCVPELVRPGSGMAFDPHDEDALARGMTALAEAPPEIEACLATVAPYTPDAAARRMFDALVSAAPT